MTIEMIDRGTILVSLVKEDMRQYSLNLDDTAPQNAEKGLKNLLYHVGEMCGLDHRGKSYLIEALPSREGCLLIISVHAVRRRRIYRIKRPKLRQVCVFRNTDDMLDYLTRCSDNFCNAALYRYEGRYMLLPAPTASDGALAALSEYGDVSAISTTVAARIQEYGKLLWQKDVQRRHISGRTVAVRDTAFRDT